MKTLSPSKLSCFFDCPQKFKYQYVDFIKREKQYPAAATGTLVHSALELLFQLPASERTLANGLRCLETSIESMPKVIAPPWPDEDKALDLILNYFDLEDPSTISVRSTEQKFYLKLDDFRALNGIVDRVDMLEDGSVRVVDYKSGKVPSEKDLPAKAQGILFYADIIARDTSILPSKLVLLYLGTPARLEIPMDDQRLETVRKQISAAWDAIDRCEEAEDWRAKPSYACKWCDYNDICPYVPKSVQAQLRKKSRETS